MIISYLDFPVSGTSVNRLQTLLRLYGEQVRNARLQMNSIEGQIKELQKQVCITVHYLIVFTSL